MVSYLSHYHSLNMSKLIPLEEVENILKKYFPDHWKWKIYSFIQEIDSIPTIDPIQTIDELQEEIKKSPDYMNDKLAWPVREKLLEELKSRLLNNK